MCEPLVKLLRKIPDDLTQCPLDWLNWFDEIGNLIYASKPLQVWFEQQSGIGKSKKRTKIIKLLDEEGRPKERQAYLRPIWENLEKPTRNKIGKESFPK
jgi:hypothetical protein